MKETTKCLVCGRLSIPYKVLRSARKTMAVQVRRDGEVIVRVPNRVCSAQVDEFVKNHESWIVRNYEKMRERLNRGMDVCWRDGAKIWVMGTLRRLCVVKRPGGGDAEVTVYEDRVQVSAAGDDERVVEAAVKSALREAARDQLIRRVRYWAAVMGVSYGRIGVREQRTRWGSCSGKGNLNFNWKLVMMPPRVLDYVVVHELAHRKEMNHSPRFWEAVGRVMPDYEQQRRELREYEDKITS